MGLFFELFRYNRYKVSQGRLIRRLTMAGVWVMFATAAWKCTLMDFTWVSRWMTWFAGLNTQLGAAAEQLRATRGTEEVVIWEARHAELTDTILAFDAFFIPVFTFSMAGLILLFGLWFGWRLVHWVTFGDFLISVEAEMAKVSWPSQQELKSATIVVLIVFLFLGGLFLIYDFILLGIFKFIGIQ